MKKKIWKCGIWIMLFLLLCTVTSFWAEERLIPEVTTAVPLLVTEEGSKTKVPAACVRTDERGRQGVWMIQQNQNIWGETEDTVFYDEGCVEKIEGDTAILTRSNEEVVVESRLPLKNGNAVKKIEEDTEDQTIFVSETGKQYDLHELERLAESVPWLVAVPTALIVLIALFWCTTSLWTEAYVNKKYFPYMPLGAAVSGVGLYAWYSLLTRCAVPQSALSEKGLLNVAVYAKRFSTFYREMQGAAGEIPSLRAITELAMANLKQSLLWSVIFLVVFFFAFHALTAAFKTRILYK